VFRWFVSSRGDESVLGRPARPSVSPFALAALLLEVIAFVILIAIQVDGTCVHLLRRPFGEWVDRMNIPFTAATLMIPLASSSPSSEHSAEASAFVDHQFRVFVGCSSG
jgi:hypothetical protein